MTSVNTTGTKGTVTLNPAATNGVWYSPGTAFASLSQGATATDSFNYTVSDGHGGTATATDTVTITGVANLPVANPDSATTTATSSGVWIGSANNDTDANGYSLSVTSVNTTGTKGTVTLNPAATNGVWYSPGKAFAYLSQGETATDSFTYTVSDGHGGTATAADTVTISGANQAAVASAAFVSTSAVNADTSTIAATAESGSTMQFLTAATGTLALSEVVAPANSATSLLATVLNTGTPSSNGWAVEIDTAATLKIMTGGILTYPSADVYLFTPANNDAQIGAGGTVSFSLAVNAGSTATPITGRLLANPIT